MNVFEFLNADTLLRKTNKVTQLVKHEHEVPASKKLGGEDYIAQIKEDGVCALVVSTFDDCMIFSRTGKLLTNCGHLSEKYNFLPPGVYMGELINRRKEVSLEMLSGYVNPNRKEALDPDAHYFNQHSEVVFFDHVYIHEFLTGETDKTYKDRLDRLHDLVDSQFIVEHSAPCTLDYAKETAEDAIHQGHEGIVICNIHSGWKAGHKGFHKMKIVRGVDYDLECIGVEEGEGKYAGKVANLIFQWRDGKEIKAMLGKGWTHDSAEKMWQDHLHATSTFGDHESPIGKIFQVTALQESSKGVLRLPKVGELRHDKVEADV